MWIHNSNEMNIIVLLQTIFAILLMGGILLQARSAGLGGAFGGDNGTGSTRRGSEKFIFTATIIVALIFFGISVVRVLVR